MVEPFASCGVARATRDLKNMTTTPRGTVRIDRVVEQLEVWLDDSFPFAKMKVKVIDRGNSDYLAVANLSVRDPKTGYPDGEAGLGGTPTEAVDDLLQRFWDKAQNQRNGKSLDEANFAWADHEDF